MQHNKSGNGKYAEKLIAIVAKKAATSKGFIFYIKG
jgi:hypothetical protein